MPGTTPAASQLDWLIPSTGAILFEGDQRTAQVINLGHGGTSIGFRTTTTVPDLCRRPHSFWTRNGHRPPPKGHATKLHLHQAEWTRASAMCMLTGGCRVFASVLL